MASLRENRAKRKLQRGGVVTMLMGGMDDAGTIDMMGQLGFDAVLIEGEHGSADFSNLADLTRACDVWGMTSVMRVSMNHPAYIYRAFDLGAQGIMVPHVNTAAEAREVVDAAKFAPIGHRGSSTGRQGYGVHDYVHKANEETLVTVLIEDIAAIDKIEEIASVDHVDVFYVAPGDLAQSMGLVGQTSHPEVQAAIDRGIKGVIEAGRVAGALANDANIGHYLDLGVRFVGVPWFGWAASGARNFLSKIEGR